MFLIKEFFTQEQYNEMWEELLFFCNSGLLLDSKEAGGAYDKSGALLRNTKGLPIESVMEDSSIISCFSKQIKQHTEFLTLKPTHLINLYNNGHYYDFHKDGCSWTAVTVFHEEPKKYTGGQLTFRDDEGIINGIELCRRDCVLFPGRLDHKVTPVHMETQDPMKGRISVSRFMR